MYSQIKTSIITTISNANQTAVPSGIRKALKLKKGDKLIWKLDPVSLQIHLRPAPKNWVEHYYGIGKSLYDGTDAQEIVNKLREDRPLP